MHESTPAWLHHPELGELPARRLVECVFALAPSGRILHFHVEQVEIAEGADGVRYRLNGQPPRDERARCQVIPPVVNAFRQPRAGAA
ncbi:MAG: hypothetical protein KDK06_21170 [Gammaproteobacteria bacterium]|nr:hypothetical protein [Gammaproteobacteria bacterium]